MKKCVQSKKTAIGAVVGFSLVLEDIFAVVDYFSTLKYASTVDIDFPEYAAVSFTDRYSLDSLI